MKFKIIEIGTSDHATSAFDISGEEIGLYVEPLFFYLSRLPNNKNIIKSPFAIMDYCGYEKIYYCSDETIKNYNLPHWVKGSNSVGKEHPIVKLKFPNITQDFLNVPVIDFSKLVDLYKIEKVDTIKIDVEGNDHLILKQLIQFVDILDVKSIQAEICMNKKIKNPNQDILYDIINDFIEIGFKKETSYCDLFLNR